MNVVAIIIPSIVIVLIVVISTITISNKNTIHRKELELMRIEYEARISQLEEKVKVQNQQKEKYERQIKILSTKRLLIMAFLTVASQYLHGDTGIAIITGIIGVILEALFSNPQNRVS